jgi:guanylate kinase
MSIILSGPSGSGKTTIADQLCARIGYRRSLSYTTRTPRPGEQDGVDYRFVSVSEFQHMQYADRFVESAYVSGNWYGTPRFQSDEKVMLVIDPQGARKLDPSILRIFIAPPSVDILRHRLISRGQDNPETIDMRMNGVQEFMDAQSEYHHTFINDDLEGCIESIIKTIHAWRGSDLISAQD